MSFSPWYFVMISYNIFILILLACMPFQESIESYVSCFIVICMFFMLLRLSKSQSIGVVASISSLVYQYNLISPRPCKRKVFGNYLMMCACFVAIAFIVPVYTGTNLITAISASRYTAYYTYQSNLKEIVSDGSFIRYLASFLSSIVLALQFYLCAFYSKYRNIPLLFLASCPLAIFSMSLGTFYGIFLSLIPWMHLLSEPFSRFRLERLKIPMSVFLSIIAFLPVIASFVLNQLSRNILDNGEDTFELCNGFVCAASSPVFDTFPFLQIPIYLVATYLLLPLMHFAKFVLVSFTYFFYNLLPMSWSFYDLFGFPVFENQLMDLNFMVSGSNWITLPTRLIPFIGLPLVFLFMYWIIRTLLVFDAISVHSNSLELRFASYFFAVIFFSFFQNNYFEFSFMLNAFSMSFVYLLFFSPWYARFLITKIISRSFFL